MKLGQNLHQSSTDASAYTAKKRCLHKQNILCGTEKYFQEKTSRQHQRQSFPPQPVFVLRLQLRSVYAVYIILMNVSGEENKILVTFLSLA